MNILIFLTDYGWRGFNWGWFVACLLVNPSMSQMKRVEISPYSCHLLWMWIWKYDGRKNKTLWHVVYLCVCICHGDDEHFHNLDDTFTKLHNQLFRRHCSFWIKFGLWVLRYFKEWNWNSRCENFSMLII